MLGRQGCQEPAHIFWGVVCGSFLVWVSSGFRNGCWEGWGVRGIPQCRVPVPTMHGAEFTARQEREQDASSGHGNAASPPLHSRSQVGLRAQRPPDLGAEDDPEKETPSAGRSGPGSRVTAPAPPHTREQKGTGKPHC